MLKKWTVIFEGATPATEDDVEIQFADVDLNKILPGYPGLKSIVFDKMKKNIDEQEHYNAFQNIKKVLNPDGEEMNVKGFLLFMGVDKNKLRFGILLALLKDGVFILALWPDEFAKVVGENENILWGVLGTMIEEPDKWERVDVILPV